MPSRFRAMAGLDQPTMIADRQPSSNRFSFADSVPMSAPPLTGDTFSAEEAFAAANATLAANRLGDSPSLPRGLLRAYSNAANPGVQQLSQPAPSSNLTAATLAGIPEASRLHTSIFREEQDLVTGHPVYHRPFDHRFSTPLSSLLEQASTPRRSSSSRRPGEFAYGSSPRGYNSSGLREATATASLFPQTMSSDHVPLPVNRSQQALGDVAHPITSWRPPASSIANQPAPSGHSRGHSRKSSLANKQAFASTATAKRLGFFKRGKNGKSQSGDGVSIMDDSRSMATWRTGSDKKCVVM